MLQRQKLFSNVMYFLKNRMKVYVSKIDKIEKCLYKYFILHIYILYNYSKNTITDSGSFIFVTIKIFKHFYNDPNCFINAIFQI